MSLRKRPTLLAPPATFSKRGAQEQEAKRARALRTWFAALADRDNNPANVVILGDSMTEGQATGITFDQRYVARLRAGIRARYPVSGVTGGAGYISTTNGLLDASVFPVVHAGTVNTNSQSGPKKRARTFNGSGQTTTWTVTGTAIDLMYWRGTGTGHVSYSIDGAGAVDVDTSGSAASGTLLRISLGATGVHTVTVAWVSGTNYVEGIIVYDGDETKGVRVHEAGRSGISAYQWDQVNHELTTSWSRAVGVALDPDLLIIALGINDYAQLVTKAAYKAAIQSMIADVRSNTTVDPSIMLVSFPTSSAAGLAPFSQYADAMEEIANEDPEICTAHLGATYSRMPDVSGDTLGLYSDTTHFSVKGHAMFADLLLPIIAPAQGTAAYQPLDADLTALAGLAGVQGDIIYRSATQWQRLPKGTAGQILEQNQAATAPVWRSRYPLLASGVLAESTPRTGPLTNAAVLSSGRISMVAIDLPAGLVINTIGFWSATTALSAGTNQWFVIVDAFNNRRFTVDDTSTAWAAHAAKPLALTASFTTLYSGFHYLGIMVAAGTVPTLACAVSSNAAGPMSATPKIIGFADTGLTTVASAPATFAALSNQMNAPYAWVA